MHYLKPTALRFQLFSQAVWKFLALDLNWFWAGIRSSNVNLFFFAFEADVFVCACIPIIFDTQTCCARHEIITTYKQCTHQSILSGLLLVRQQFFVSMTEYVHSLLFKQHFHQKHLSKRWQSATEQFWLPAWNPFYAHSGFKRITEVETPFFHWMLLPFQARQIPCKKVAN